MTFLYEVALKLSDQLPEFSHTTQKRHLLMGINETKAQNNRSPDKV